MLVRAICDIGDRSKGSFRDLSDDEIGEMSTSSSKRSLKHLYGFEIGSGEGGVIHFVFFI
jgi:hypothetical protein